MRWPLFTRWLPGKKSPSQKQEREAKFKSITHASEAVIGKAKVRQLKWYDFRLICKDNDKGSPRDNDKGGTPNGFSSIDNNGQVPKGDGPSTPVDYKSPNGDAGLHQSLSRNSSTRDGNLIMFSYSVARRKPPPMEKTVECTLEDLCHGCVKRINLTREVLADNGLMMEEQELLRIKVKAGWKQGTKITFEGKGDARPGMLPSDVIFSIVEEKHSLFKREGNDLVYKERIPLVNALSGCTLSIPLLGGEKMNCSIDEIVYPGYEKIIEGQGMPIADESSKRGDLRVKFQVDFPTHLREDQRDDIYSLLRDVS